MARWITQTFSIDENAEIQLCGDMVNISDSSGCGLAVFKPKNLQDAMGMSIALRAAAKRLEDIGKGLK